MESPLSETVPTPAGCGAPSVWSADGRAIVLSCIGCGKIDTAQQCAGTCGEYRLEIVPAATHDRAAARLDVERRRAEALGAMCGRLAEHMPAAGSEAAYRTLQTDARDVLHALAAATPGDDHDESDAPLAVWSCGCCGRVEAEAPCVGVCSDVRLEVVRAGVHSEVRAQLRIVGARVRELGALVRRLAFVTPRPGGWEASLGALQEGARDVIEGEAPASERFGWPALDQ